MRSHQKVGLLYWSSSLILFRILMCAICLKGIVAWAPSPSYRQFASNYADQPSVIYPSSNRMLKKSEPEWEDLGWAWGKRSGGAAIIHEPEYRMPGMLPDLGWPWGKRSQADVRSVGSGAGLSATQLRVLSMVKKENPDWHDLGWAWGKRR